MWSGLQVNWGTKKIINERFRHSLSTRQNANMVTEFSLSPGNCPRDTCYLLLAISTQVLIVLLHIVFLQQMQNSEASYLLHKRSKSVSGQAFTHIPHQQVRASPTTFVAEILLCVFCTSPPEKSSTTSHSYKV